MNDPISMNGIGLSMKQELEESEDSDRKETSCKQSEIGSGAYLDVEEESMKEPVALCMPGGGIRCAAFSHGALRYLATRERFKIEAISCVSGGGYTGCAFVQNVYEYMNSGYSYRAAVNQFFESKSMSKNSGFLANFSGTWTEGITEVVCLVLILVVWALLLILEKVPLMFFVALVVDSTFGDPLRAEGWSGIQAGIIQIAMWCLGIWTFWILLRVLPRTDLLERLACVLQIGFIIFLGFLGMLFFVKLQHGNREQGPQHGTTFVLFVVVLVLALRPVFQYLSPAKRVLSIFAYAAIFSRVSYWHVYRNEPSELIFGWMPYSVQAWNILLLISGLLLFFPFQLIQKTFFHYYYVWRIEKSFFVNSGVCGFKCDGVHNYLKDFRRYPEIPTYIALTSLNGWKKNAKSKEDTHLMGIETGGTLRLIGDDVCMDIGHTKLSEVCALSGAALAYRMAGVHNDFVRFWQVELGISLGNWLYTKPPGSIRWFIALLAQSPMTIFALLYFFAKLPAFYVFLPMMVYAGIIICAVAFPPARVASLFHIPFVLTLNDILDLVVIGGDPLPQTVSVSDGAHGENLGLLPLLERRSHKTIVICDGSEDPEETCQNLLISLNLARQKLRCSFTPIGEAEGHSDIEKEIQNFAQKKSSASFRFAVYYDSNISGEYLLNRSDIIYIKPRRDFAFRKTNLGQIDGCCCEGCHRASCEWTRACCGTFPQHSIANQFFTPALFDHYELLGYRTTEDYFQSLAFVPA